MGNTQLVTMVAQKHGQLEHFHHGFYVGKSCPQAEVNTG